MTATALLAAGALSLMLHGGVAKVSIEKVAYGGWPNCYRMSNDQIELIATTDVGPRIIRFGFVGGRNEFKEYADQMGKQGEEEWMIRGGHRLWHSPERKPRSYGLDNSPIDAKVDGERLILTQPVEPDTHIRKQIIIEMASDQPAVRVIHRLRNEGQWPIQLAAWCLTVMAQGGTCIIPFPRHDDPKGLLPNRALALWPYTDPTDPRVHIGRHYLMLRQDPNAAGPCKFGVARVTDEWMAYLNDDVLFVKRFDWLPGAEYPDYGSCVETYTNPDMLEVETVGPLEVLDTGDELEHVERWYLLRVPEPVRTEDDVDRLIRPLVETETR